MGELPGLSSSCLRSLWPGSPPEPDCSAVLPRTRGGIPADARPRVPRGELPGRLCGHSGCCSPGCQSPRAWRRLTPGSKWVHNGQGCVFPPEALKCDGKASALKLETLREYPEASTFWQGASLTHYFLFGAADKTPAPWSTVTGANSGEHWRDLGVHQERWGWGRWGRSHVPFLGPCREPQRSADTSQRNLG